MTALVFSLLHGDLETADDVARLDQMRALARSAGALTVTRGGNDWTSWTLAGPEAGLTLLALEGLAGQIGPSWWRWTTDGRMPTMDEWARVARAASCTRNGQSGSS